jgi:type IV secretory pathway VirB4 component
MWGGVVPKVGRHFVQVVSIEGFPLASSPGMLNLLAELPGVYRWSSRFIFLDAHEAVAHLEQYRKKWKQKIRGFFDQVFNLNSSVIDEDALNMTNDAQSAIAETNSGMVGQGYYTSVVVLMHEERAALSAAARQVEKAVNQLGFAARIETINTLDAYLGSLPGHGVENVRRPLINTLNLAGTELEKRLSANRCEYCGKEGGYLEVHHVRKLKDVQKGKMPWQKQMAEMRRKTLILCIHCHKELHHGNLKDWRRIARKRVESPVR